MLKTHEAIKLAASLLRADASNPAEVEHIMAQIESACKDGFDPNQIERDAAYRMVELINEELTRGNIVGIAQTAFERFIDEQSARISAKTGDTA